MAAALMVMSGYGINQSEPGTVDALFHLRASAFLNLLPRLVAYCGGRGGDRCPPPAVLFICNLKHWVFGLRPRLTVWLVFVHAGYCWWKRGGAGLIWRGKAMWTHWKEKCWPA